MANLPLIRGSLQTNLRCLTEGSRGLDIMAMKQTDIADSLPINEIMESDPLFTRREMLGVAGVAGLTALAGMTPLAGSAASAVPQTMQTRPRIGGSSIPTYFRKPEIDLAIDTPIKSSIVVGD